MKHWHKCSRWNERGFRCPFRLLELSEEREPEDAEIEVQEHRLERHAAQAEETALVQVPAVKRRELSLLALSEVVVASGQSGLLNAVSTSVVPPFEAPINIPNFVMEAANEQISGGSSAVIQHGVTIPQATVAQVEVPATAKPAPNPRPPRETTNAAIPRIVELSLIKLLAEATAPAPAQERPAPARVGAPYSRGASAQDDALFVSAQNPRQIDLTQAYLIEAALISAIAFGTIESIRAFRNAKGTAFTNNPVGGFRGAKPILDVPAPKKTAPRYIPTRFKGTPVGGGPLPGNSSLLRDLGASLVQAVKRGPQ